MTRDRQKDVDCLFDDGCEFLVLASRNPDKEFVDEFRVGDYVYRDVVVVLMDQT